MTTISYSGFDQEADWEEGRPTDADALSPDWDHTVLENLSEADSETDTDGDLNDSTAAVKIGTNGFRFTFDDANAAYITINATSVDRTKATIDIYLKPDNLLANAEQLQFIRFVDGGSSQTWNAVLRRNVSGDLLFIVNAFLDGGGASSSNFIVADGTYHHIRYVFERSSGAGNDDGYLKVYKDSVLEIDLSGIDNDTQDWDTIEVGARVITQSSGFSGSMDFDEIRVSESVSPVWITEAAALEGDFGAAFTIEDTTHRLVQLTDPTSETQVTAECRIDPNTLTMGTGEQFQIINITPQTFVVLRWDGSNYVIWARAETDGGFESTNIGNYTITDAPHTIRVVWQASSGVGNDDGELHLYSGGVLQESLTGLDNDTISVDTVEFGARGPDSGTSGVFFMDDMKWSNSLSATATQDAVLTTTATLLSGSHTAASTVLKNFHKRRTRYTMPERVTQFNFGKRNTEFTFKVYDDD